MKNSKHLLFQDRARDTHDRLMMLNSSLFSAAELKRLIEMPSKEHGYTVPWYNESDIRFLEELRWRILATKTSAVREEAK